MRVACVEWPEGLSVDDTHWTAITRAIAAARPELLVTNELPFGPWIAGSAAFSEDDAKRSIRAHEQGLEGLRALDLPAIVSSRPVWSGTRLANEAFVLEAGTVRPLHRKQYFPNEPGWFESAWYEGDASGFAVAEVLGLKIGVLLCTEAMFNEHARAYGRQGASLIVIPRASGKDIAPWKTAGAMAALVSGAYAVSSNRSGGIFGGGGFAYAPQGCFLAETNSTDPIRVIDLDLNLPGFAQRAYPCYVAELDKDHAAPDR